MNSVNALNEVMKNFNLVFATYIVLFIVVIINLLKVIYLIKKSKLNDMKVLVVVDLIIDIFCGLAMFGGLIFMGTLAEYNALGWTKWNTGLYFITAISFIIFIINIGILAVKGKQ